MDNPIGEAIPKGNFAELGQEMTDAMAQEPSPGAFDGWTDLVNASWSLAMLPALTWTALVTTSLRALELCLPAR